LSGIPQAQKDTSDEKSTENKKQTNSVISEEMRSCPARVLPDDKEHGNRTKAIQLREML
jgi:hypothetical protein